MLRRHFLKNTAGTALAIHPITRALSDLQVAAIKGDAYFITSGPAKPLFIYDNWSAYDELSDNIPLTEELAMNELNELIRLKKMGVKFDYYVMDAFWFDKTGGYRTWDKQHWPNGPDKWLKTCLDNQIRPGMWFSTNLIATQSGPFLDVIPEWQDSLATDPNIMCLFTGGYLKHLDGTLQIWYDRGVRVFKFDFAYFEAATPAAQAVHTPEEIAEMNKLALMDMLKQFRNRNNDVLITGYNGFGGDMENTFTPFRKTVDPRWMEVFDTIYSGDPRFSDVPMMNIWRSQDNYSDHMVRQFEFNGLPLRRIDNCAFMIGKTGTCYYRANHAWKGMLILELGRGGWLNVYHGNMELISDEDGAWFAKTQAMFEELQRYAIWSSFGSIPGKGEPYGFKAEGINGSVLTLVNPSQTYQELQLPVNDMTGGMVIYADAGYKPVLSGRMIKLGPEQLVVLGFGVYGQEKYNLGVDNTILIPQTIENMETVFEDSGKNTIRTQVKPLPGYYIRILVQQLDKDGLPRRSWGGAPPDGKKMDEFIKIEVSQGKKSIPLRIEYDKMIWSGLSWGAGEINPRDLDTSQPLEITCISTETDSLVLKASVYQVSY